MSSAPPALLRANAQRDRKRLAALFAVDILQAPREPLLERILNLAHSEFGMDSAAIVLIDHSTAIFHLRAGVRAKRCPRENWPCNLTIQGTEPLILQDTALDMRTAHMPKAPGTPTLRSYAGFPLLTRDNLAIGTLALFSEQPGQVPQDKIHLGQQLAAMVMDAVELSRLALHDPLTGALNRRGFTNLFEEEIRKSAEEERPLCFAMLDIDYFKSINDTYGHGVGDQVLRSLVGHVARTLGPDHTVGRLGGEEFAIIFKGLNTDDAFALVERVRIGLPEMVIPDAANLRVTASIGLAELGIHARNASELLARSDSALYEAKQTQKNRTVTARPIPVSANTDEALRPRPS